MVLSLKRYRSTTCCSNCSISFPFVKGIPTSIHLLIMDSKEKTVCTCSMFHQHDGHNTPNLQISTYGHHVLVDALKTRSLPWKVNVENCQIQYICRIACVYVYIYIYLCEFLGTDLPQEPYVNVNNFKNRIIFLF